MGRAYRTLCDGCGEEITDNEKTRYVNSISEDLNRFGEPMGRQLHLHERCSKPFDVVCTVCGAIADGPGTVVHDAAKHGAAPKKAPDFLVTGAGVVTATAEFSVGEASGADSVFEPVVSAHVEGVEAIATIEPREDPPPIVETKIDLAVIWELCSTRQRALIIAGVLVLEVALGFLCWWFGIRL